jgi:hypothetical protein
MVLRLLLNQSTTYQRNKHTTILRAVLRVIGGPTPSYQLSPPNISKNVITRKQKKHAKNASENKACHLIRYSLH